MLIPVNVSLRLMQVYAAVHQVRIEQFVNKADRAAARISLLEHGLDVPMEHSVTPADVQASSRNCNAPGFRQKNAADGAVMR